MSAAGPPQGAKAPSGGSAAHAVASVGAVYTGRFAPSPTGPLHAGSLVAALASWLDARSQGGQWLVRLEDVDTPRCVRGADHTILQQLAACGLHPDAPPVWQSQRGALYQQALDRLIARGLAYPCACSRKDIEDALAQAGIAKQRHAELVYPGTCRHGLLGRAGRAWRARIGQDDAIRKKVPNRAASHDALALLAIKNVASKENPLNCETPLAEDTQPAAQAVQAIKTVRWHDRRLGAQVQNLPSDVGDFVLRRADGLWAYQLAVVVDDAAQGITHVVRGQDLADNTARQIWLQRALGLPTPHYLHTPLVLGADGDKLSKQNGAQAIDTSTPRAAWAALQSAAAVLGLQASAPAPNPAGTEPELATQLAAWVRAWGTLQQPPPTYGRA